MLLQANQGSANDPRVDWNSVLGRWQLLPNDPVHRTQESFAQNLSGRTIREAAENSDGWIANLRILSWDSEFFGLKMARLEPFVGPSGEDTNARDRAKRFVRECLREASREDVEHLSVQVHSADLVAQFGLQQEGFSLADTIVEYRAGLSGRHLPAAAPQVVPAIPEQREAIANIAGECFSNPILNANRFNNDRTFSKEQVREMYSLWAARSIDKILADEVFVYLEKGAPVGFITVSLPSAVRPSVASIPLNAVHPAFHGRGIYTELVKAAHAWLQARDVPLVEIRTQLPNCGVHRAWCKLGGQMNLALHTFHCSSVKSYAGRGHDD